VSVARVAGAKAEDKPTAAPTFNFAGALAAPKTDDKTPLAFAGAPSPAKAEEKAPVFGGIAQPAAAGQQLGALGAVQPKAKTQRYKPDSDEQVSDILEEWNERLKDDITKYSEAAGRVKEWDLKLGEAQVEIQTLVDNALDLQFIRGGMSEALVSIQVIGLRFSVLSCIFLWRVEI
jgi:Nsp1-like C-terminal region